MFFIYVLSSEKNGYFYVGMTQDVSLRLKQHNAGKTQSTKAYRPWVLFFSESYETRDLARKREVYLKSGVGKEYIKKIWPGSSAG